MLHNSPKSLGKRWNANLTWCYLVFYRNIFKYDIYKYRFMEVQKGNSQQELGLFVVYILLQFNPFF